MLSDNNDENRRIFTLETRRKQKTEKYKELVQESEQQFGCKVRFSVIIESSLGALPKETISELRKFTMNKRKLNLLCRRIVGASFTNSMLIYYNLDFEKDDEGYVDQDQSYADDTNDTENTDNPNEPNNGANTEEDEGTVIDILNNEGIAPL